VGTGLRTAAILSLKWIHVRPDLKQYWVPAEFMKGKDGEARPTAAPRRQEAAAQWWRAATSGPGRSNQVQIVLQRFRLPQFFAVRM
jgi:hypothetical protein